MFSPIQGILQFFTLLQLFLSNCHQEDIDSLKALQNKVKGRRAAARAKAFAESKAQEEQPEKNSEAAEETASILNQDAFDLNPRRLKQNIIAFPPDFEPIPCKPLLFDLAVSDMPIPDLSERKKAKAKGGFFSFWRS